jgi:hypothetical protein
MYQLICHAALVSDGYRYIEWSVDRAAIVLGDAMATTRSALKERSPLDTSVRAGSRASAVQWLERALWLVVVAFGVAIGVGIVGTVWGVVHLSHPAPGHGYTVLNDAIQISTGHWPWQDPANGYVGLIYPPVFSGVVAAFLRLHMWSGWTIVLSILSSLALAAMVAKTAYRRVGTPSATSARVLEAAAVGLVGLWLVTCSPTPGLDGFPDPAAWALALGGLLLVPRALTGSRGAMVAAVVLMTLGFWTKQHAQGAITVAVVWGVMAAVAGVVAWRRVALLTASLAVANVAIFGFLYVTSDGWAYYYIFQMARDHAWGVMPMQILLKGDWQIGWLPLAFTAVMLMAAGWANVDRRLGWRGRALVQDRDVQQLVLLLLFVICVTPVAIFSQRHQGSTESQLIGPLWGLALLAAFGWRLSGHRLGARIVTGLAVVVLASLSLQFGNSGADEVLKLTGMNRIREAVTITHFPQVREDLLAAARDHTVYDWYHVDLGMEGDHVPSSAIVCDVTAAGLSAGALERDFLTRRYDLVMKAPRPYSSRSCAGFGKWEANYFWKLNALIDVGYRPNRRRYAADVLERRPGRAPVATLHELARCFAPYRLGGVLFRIGMGGGFWCQSTPTDPRLRLRLIPLSPSVVLTDGTVTSATGSIVITLPAGSGNAAVAVARGPADFDVVATLASAAGSKRRAVVTLGTRRGAAANAAVRDGIQEQLVDPAKFNGHRLAVVATAINGAQFDFSGMTLKTKGGVVRGAAARRGLP